MRKLSTHDIQQYRTIFLFACTIGVWFVFHAFLTKGVLFTPRNLSALSVQMTVTTILAVGMTWLLVAREIDLSVGATLSLVMVVTFQMFADGSNASLAAIPLVLALGTIVGLLQGAVGYIPPSISIGLVALMAVYIAIRLLRSQRQMSSNGSISSSFIMLLGFAVVMAGVMAWAFYSWRGMPYPVLLMAAVVLFSDWISRDTTFGRYVYAIGGNPEAARRAGIPVHFITLGLFAIMGFLAGVAATVQGSLLDAAPPNIGELLALSAISAAVIGGTNLFGGYGSIPGTVGGALLMASIANGLSLAGVNTFYQMIATGIILVVAVAIDSITRKRSQERVS